MSITDTAEVIDLTVGPPTLRNATKEGPIEPVEETRTPSASTHAKQDAQAEVAEDIPSKPSGPKRKRNKKKQSESKPTTQDATDDQPPPLAEEDGLFFVDLAPIPLAIQPGPVEAAPEEEDKAHKLLLPAHVSVFGSTPVEILAPATSLEDDSIQFLDYDDGKVFHRYWEEQEPAKQSRMICKNCGGEGHKGYECTVLICLTCGARDDHSTRSCPISKECFNCGMKGHISANCPNRGGYGIRTSSRFIDCERCSSAMHKTNECPTWWRMYLYLSDDAQAKVLSYRKDRQGTRLGEGGEGYIADDQWCYMCGNLGHLGDDCEDYQQPDRPREPSAFSTHNIASGPFYDPDTEAANSSKIKSRPRAPESFMDLEKVPDNVGRRGRDKARSKLTKAAQSRVEDDADDWFNRNNKPSGKSTSSSSSKKPKIQFSDSLRGGDKRSNGYQNGNSGGGAKLSLLERMGDPTEGSEGSRRSKKRKEREPDIEFDYDYDDDHWNDSRAGPMNGRSQDSQRHHHHSRDRTREAGRDKGRNWDRDRDRDRDRGDRDRRRTDNSSHRPRYKGGYSR
ncbi:hypothetical protein BKA70DRAFT_559493 [Coprinopsis sp. MPI-PUGE-AT-0042]|nr:hypothetical protein BKA70DRAFT_559493 [Coprinopsis sp. MPI-PUGE-AT-0042]